jgi:hypothetical protein
MNNFSSNKSSSNNFYPIPLSNNVNSNHPIINNANDYFFYRKYISIHSEDRDITKYPNASQFEIEMPEDYVNVLSIKLENWSFPANYDTFSELNGNTTMTFQIPNPFNPGENNISDPFQNAIFEALYYNANNNYSFIISDGFYSPDLITTELTNRFNYAVTQVITTYFTEQGYTDFLEQFNNQGGYTDFVVVYNNVQQNLWFGNASSVFVLTNTSTEIVDALNNSNLKCATRNQLPDYSNWGLPFFLGLPRTDVVSIQSAQTPRFFFGDILTSGDNGYWLLPNPNLPGCQVSYISAPLKINFMGPAYIYMELDGLNCIDETSPYNLSKFTAQTNETNGVANAAFAKIPIPATPLSQYFDNEHEPRKFFLPPAERIRRLKIKFRYHNGQLVNFSNFDYSFMLEFTLLSPQIERKYNIFNPIFS